MDKLADYPKLIKRILTEYVELCNRHPQPDIETFLIVDEAKAHYIWMISGLAKWRSHYWDDSLCSDSVPVGCVSGA